MEDIITKSNARISQVNLSFQRGLLNQIDWEYRLIGLLGARGVGKTTMLLQKIKISLWKQKTAIYASLDDFYFLESRLFDFIAEARSKGYKQFFLDEIHKYPGWARELKMVYDNFPDIKIVFTGSSIIELLNQDVDLSRRALKYELYGLSFREYLQFENVLNVNSYSIDDLIHSHIDIAYGLDQDFKPLVHFEKYLEMGYYPFYRESGSNFSVLLGQVVRFVVDSDLRFIEGYDPKNARKIMQLLYILAKNVPFKPNISKLSDKIGIHRNTLVQYIHYLERASLIHILSFSGKSISQLQKPDKILLNDPNLARAIAPEGLNVGSMRESFFVSQVKVKHDIALHSEGDFLVDDVVFEVGGKDKSQKQIKSVPNAYLALDNIEQGTEGRIPLWMFGLLY